MKPLLLASAIIACAPGVAAAAPWSPAQPIAGSENAGTPHVVFTRAGHGLAVYWTNRDAPRRTGTLHGASTTGPGTFGPARTLGRLNLSALGAYGSDRVIAFGTTGARHPRAAVAFGSPDAGFGPANAVGPRSDSQLLDGAVNDRGDAAALLLVGRTPYLVKRRAGRSFGRAVRLGRGPTTSGAVSVNVRGDVLVVWERPLSGMTGTRGVYARLLTSHGRLGVAQRLGTAVPLVSISAALDDARRAVVAWLGQRVSEGDAESAATIKYAAAPPAQRFGTEHTVEVVDVLGTGRYVTAPGVRAAIGADGRGLLTWTGHQDGHFVVRAAPLSDGALGVAQIVSDPAADSVLGALSTGPRGEAVVLARQGISGADPTSRDGVTLTAAARALPESPPSVRLRWCTTPRTTSTSRASRSIPSATAPSPSGATSLRASCWRPHASLLPSSATIRERGEHANERSTSEASSYCTMLARRQRGFALTINIDADRGLDDSRAAG